MFFSPSGHSLMVNLSRILKSLAVEHSLAVLAGFCIYCFSCFCLMAAQMNLQLAGYQIPVFFLFLSLFSWPLLFFIEYLQFFPTYFVFSSWCKLHCFNSWTFQVVNVFQEIFIIWLENRCLIVQSAYYSQPKGYLTA